MALCFNVIPSFISIFIVVPVLVSSFCRFILSLNNMSPGTTYVVYEGPYTHTHTTAMASDFLTDLFFCNDFIQYSNIIHYQPVVVQYQKKNYNLICFFYYYYYWTNRIYWLIWLHSKPNTLAKVFPTNFNWIGQSILLLANSISIQCKWH